MFIVILKSAPHTLTNAAVLLKGAIEQRAVCILGYTSDKREFPDIQKIYGSLCHIESHEVTDIQWFESRKIDDKYVTEIRAHMSGVTAVISKLRESVIDVLNVGHMMRAYSHYKHSAEELDKIIKQHYPFIKTRLDD